MAAPQTAEAFWAGKVRRVQQQIGAGWFLQAALPAFFVWSLGVSILLLTARRAGWPLDMVAWGVAGTFFLAPIYAVVRSRRRFPSLREARARLEDMLHLHTGLSAAAAGVAPWPEKSQWRPHAWQWNARRMLTFPVLSLALIVAAFLIPMKVVRPVAVAAVKPPALQEIEDWLEALAQMDAVEPESLEEFREQAQKLAEQDPAEWYTHANLEAADHLRAKMMQGMGQFAGNAGQIEGMLPDSSEIPALPQNWAQQMQAALGMIEGGQPRLNKAMAQSLHSIDPSNLSAIDPAALERTRQALKDAEGACRKCLGDEPGDGGEGKEKEGGRGGLDRGPGSVPLTLEEQETNLQTKKLESLQNDDTSRASLGDLAGFGAGQHDVDRSLDLRRSSGGAVSTAGAGADAVWRDQNLPPEERNRLRKFFQ